MHAQYQTPRGTVLNLHLPLQDFLASGQMRQQAMVNLCTTEALLMDHLPAVDDIHDDDELAQAFAEAAELASDETVTRVRLDRNDLRYVRRSLFHNFAGWQLLEAPEPRTAA